MFGELFGVVEPFDVLSIGEDDRRCINRPCKWAAPSLVNAADDGNPGRPGFPSKDQRSVAAAFMEILR